MRNCPRSSFSIHPGLGQFEGFDDDSVPYTLEPNEVSLFLEEEQQRLSEFFARYPPIEDDTMAKNLSDIEALLNQILRELADEEIIEYERDLLARRLQIVAKNSVQMQVGIIFYDMGIPNTECCRQQIANDSRLDWGMPVETLIVPGDSLPFQSGKRMTIVKNVVTKWVICCREKTSKSICL